MRFLEGILFDRIFLNERINLRLKFFLRNEFRLNRLLVSMADLDLVVAVSITTPNPVGLTELLVKSGRTKIMNEGRLIIHNTPPTIKYMLDKAGDHTSKFRKWDSDSTEGEIERKNMLLFGYDMLMYR